MLPDDRVVVFGGRTKERGVPNRSVEVVDVRKNTVTLRNRTEVPVVASGALDYPAGRNKSGNDSKHPSAGFYYWELSKGSLYRGVHRVGQVLCAFMVFSQLKGVSSG